MLFVPWVIGTPQIAGLFGDMFGALNALFAGLAFAGVIVAIFMQGEELSLQRQELQESRKAQEAQAKALIIAAQVNGHAVILANNTQLDGRDLSGRAAYQIWKAAHLDKINQLTLQLDALSPPGSPQ